MGGVRGNYPGESGSRQNEVRIAVSDRPVHSPDGGTCTTSRLHGRMDLIHMWEARLAFLTPRSGSNILDILMYMEMTLDGSVGMELR